MSTMLEGADCQKFANHLHETQYYDVTGSLLGDIYAQCSGVTHDLQSAQARRSDVGR